MIRSERNVYVAGHVTPEVKDALIAKTKEMDISQSEFIFEAIKEKLTKEGCDLTVKAYLENEDPRLPLEGDE